MAILSLFGGVGGFVGGGRNLYRISQISDRNYHSVDNSEKIDPKKTPKKQSRFFFGSVVVPTTPF